MCDRILQSEFNSENRHGRMTKTLLVTLFALSGTVTLNVDPMQASAQTSSDGFVCVVYDNSLSNGSVTLVSIAIAPDGKTAYVTPTPQVRPRHNVHRADGKQKRWCVRTGEPNGSDSDGTGWYADRPSAHQCHHHRLEESWNPVSSSGTGTLNRVGYHSTWDGTTWTVTK